MNEESQLQAQGLFDAFKLLDADLIAKVRAISKLIKIEQLEDGKITRITIDIMSQ
jgi:hypothetical protein